MFILPNINAERMSRHLLETAFVAQLQSLPGVVTGSAFRTVCGELVARMGPIMISGRDKSSLKVVISGPLRSACLFLKIYLFFVVVTVLVDDTHRIA